MRILFITQVLYSFQAINISLKYNNIDHLTDEFLDSRRIKSQIINLCNRKGDENPKLVSQAGLFTRIPDDMDLETWVTSHCKDEQGIVLAKIHIPKS